MRAEWYVHEEQDARQDDEDGVQSGIEEEGDGLLGSEGEAPEQQRPTKWSKDQQSQAVRPLTSRNPDSSFSRSAPSDVPTRFDIAQLTLLLSNSHL